MEKQVIIEKEERLSGKQKKRIKIGLGIFVTILLTIAWLMIVKYGIHYGKIYIDDAMAQVELRNIENHQRLTEQNLMLNKEIETLNDELASLRGQVKALNDDIDVFSLDVSALKSSIEFIDTSVNNSMVIQSEIGNRIQELDNRLQELKKSLNILLEAP